MTRCALCENELGPQDSTPARTLGDCHPLCRNCHKNLGKRVAPSRRTLERELYAAGRSLSRCQCCGMEGEMEHHFLVPLARGGAAGSRNILVLCLVCHSKVHQGARIIVRFDPVPADSGPQEQG